MPPLAESSRVAGLESDPNVSVWVRRGNQTESFSGEKRHGWFRWQWRADYS